MKMDVDKICRYYDDLKQRRVSYEPTWDEITELVVPSRPKFQDKSPRYEPELHLYDSTAVRSNEALAATLMNGLVDQSTRWFDLEYTDPEAENNPLARQIIEERVDAMLDTLHDPTVGFYTGVAELFIDLCAYGTACLESTYYPGHGIKYKTIHLAGVYIDVDKAENVDTVFTSFMMTPRQAAQMWGEEALSKNMRDKLEQDPYCRVEIVRCVKPHHDYKKKRKNKSYYSAYVDIDSKHLISEGDLKGFPYVVPRWSKLAEREYGISPAWNALPDIRMVQGMAMNALDASSKLADPTLLAADDGVMLPINTEPGGLIFGGVDPVTGRQRVQPLNTGASPQLFEALIAKYQDSIRQSFYNNALLNQDRPQMTAEEVATLRAEALQFIAPNINRVLQEAITPIVLRHYKLMEEHNLFPELGKEIKNELKGLDLKVRFTSPLARIRKLQDAESINRYLQTTVIPLLQINPELLDIVNLDQSLGIMADGYGIPLSALRAPQEVLAIREQRAIAQAEQERNQLALESERLDIERQKAQSGPQQPGPGEVEL